MAYRVSIELKNGGSFPDGQGVFPLLVDVKAPYLRLVAHGGHVIDGQDLRFTSTDSGAVLASRVESFDGVRGRVRAWVGMPAGVGAVIYLEYGQVHDMVANALWDGPLQRLWSNGEGVKLKMPGLALDGQRALTVEAWFENAADASEAMQVLTAQWGHRQRMDAFVGYDAGNTDGLNTRGYFGATFDGRHVYFAPQFNGEERHGNVLRYDTHGPFDAVQSWQGYNAGLTDGLSSKGYYGAVHAAPYVYYVPRTDDGGFHTRILRYDTRQPFTEAVGWAAYDVGYAMSYQSAAFDGRYIYFVPGYDGQGTHGKVLRYDTAAAFDDPAAYSLYDAGQTDGLASVCYDGAVFDGRYVFFAPLSDQGIVLRYDTRGDFSASSSWNAYQAKHTCGLEMGMCVGAIFDGRYVYFVAYSGHSTVRYDTQGDFADSSSWSGYDTAAVSGLDTIGYDGAFFDGRYLYFIPFYRGLESLHGFHNEWLRYDTRGDFSAVDSWLAVDAGQQTQPAHPGGFNGGAFDGRFFYGAPWREDPGPDDEADYTPHGKVLRYDTADAGAAFFLKSADCGHNGGLGAALPGAVFAVNTDGGIRSVRMDRPLEPGWHHLAGVYDGANLSLYVDGHLVRVAPGGGAIKADEVVPLTIGSFAEESAAAKGEVAVVRVSDTVRSAVWINAACRNLHDPGDFVGLGQEEVR
jgi:hypothetical protein